MRVTGEERNSDEYDECAQRTDKRNKLQYPTDRSNRQRIRHARDQQEGAVSNESEK